MAERDRFKTLKGDHSSLCHTCGRIVYQLWVSEEAPPWGCCEGHDSEPWKCGHVYAALVAMVIGIDHFNRAPDERQEALLQLLGEKRVGEMFAFIRSGAQPKSHRPKEPDYERRPQLS